MADVRVKLPANPSVTSAAVLRADKQTSGMFLPERSGTFRNVPERSGINSRKKKTKKNLECSGTFRNVPEPSAVALPRRPCRGGVVASASAAAPSSSSSSGRSSSTGSWRASRGDGGARSSQGDRRERAKVAPDRAF